jgi:T5orf172 domain
MQQVSIRSPSNLALMTQSDEVVYAGDVEPPKSEADIRRAEVSLALYEDESLLGDVYRLWIDGKKPDEIQIAQSKPTIGYVYAYVRSIRVLLDEPEVFPSSPSVAKGVLQSVRRIAKRNDQNFSPTTQEWFRSQIARLESVVADERAVAEEVEEALDATRKAEMADSQAQSSLAHAKGSIYVYSLPHYLRYRVHEDSGRTFLKVGRTKNDPSKRIDEQARQTGLPEDPVMLRTYRDSLPNRELPELEKLFHVLLDAADHERSKGKSAGLEWFVTSVKFTEAVAVAMGLEIQEISDLGN